MFFHGGVFVSFIALMTIGGFPPLAGFSAKLHFVEIFLNNQYYYTLAFILITTVFTMYAYFNFAAALLINHRRVDANKMLYHTRISDIDDFAGAVLALLFIILALMALYAPSAESLKAVYGSSLPFF